MSELSEVRRELAAMRDDVTRTANNVDWIKGAMGHQAATLDDHEKRIRFTERWQWLISGGAGVIGWLLGFGGSGGVKS